MRLHNVAKNAGGVLTTISDRELDALHKILLMIYDDFINICEVNGLKFTMIGGSAIGALRHDGFIPWDDDIDLAMPRADFEKLLNCIKEEYAEKYSVLYPQDKHNFGRLIPKMRLKGTEYRTILERDLDECGIFLDIYLIENAYDNKFMRKIQGTMSMGLGYLISCLRLYKGRKFYKSLMNGAEFKVKCVIGFLISFISIERWTRWTDYWHSRCKNSDSEYITIPADGKHFFGGLQKRRDFCDFKEVTFEGRKSFVPGNYDEYLRGYYGDYMKIPPKEKQERCRYIKFDLGKYGENTND